MEENMSPIRHGVRCPTGRYWYREPVYLVKVDNLIRSPYYWSRSEEDDTLAELTKSIADWGVQTPIVVKGYHVLRGWCRVLVCRRLGIETIPAIHVAWDDPKPQV